MPELDEVYERSEGASRAIDDAAWLVLGPGLRGGNSPILGDEPTWTAANARELSRLVGAEDTRPLGFLEKLGEQLENAPRGVVALAAELLFLHVLPLENVTKETKVERISTVLSFGVSPSTLPDGMRHGLELSGVFHGGPGFNFGIWKQMLWLCRFVEAWTVLPGSRRERALSNPWAFRDEAAGIPGKGETSMRMSLQMLVWPGYFDEVIKDDHRRRIRDAFVHRIGGIKADPEADVDYDLWRIREAVQDQGRPRVDWYVPPFSSEWGWHTDGTSKSGRRAWLVRTGQGGAHLAELWREEGFVSLPATNLQLDLEEPTESTIRDAVDAGYTHLDYAQRLQLTQADQAFILRMSADDLVVTLSGEQAALGVVSGEPTWAEVDGSRLRRAIEWIPEAVAKAELPEPVPGMLDKQGDVVDLTTALDALAALADGLTDTVEVKPADEKPRISRPPAAVVPAVTDGLAAGLHMPADVLQEWLDVLAERRQIIFYGPPGTGKTFVAEALGRHIVGSDTNHLRTVQFHPSFAYEDFFEGLRPTVEDGNVTYQVVPGPLRSLVAEATAPGNESRPYVLVIDEMNRANLAKVFGELYYLLEYRDQSISLQYSRDTDFRLPKNLYIIGTMNTLDRSISMVDAAIRRRFPFVELHPAVEPVSKVLSEYLAAEGSDDRRAQLLDALNAGIDERDLQIGPSYLMKKSAGDDSGLERIWKYDILPLLDDHFYGARTPEQVRVRFGLAALLARLPGSTVGPVDAALDTDIAIDAAFAEENAESTNP